MINRLISFFIFVFSITAFAQTDIDCIWIKHTDNSLSCIKLDEKPQISFVGESIIIDSKSYQIADIVSYRFGNSKESSLDINSSGNVPCVVFRDKEIEIYLDTVFDSDFKGSIYDTRGIEVKSFKSDRDSRTVWIDIADLTSGVYFLSFQHSTLKFVKK